MGDEGQIEELLNEFDDGGDASPDGTRIQGEIAVEPLPTEKAEPSGDARTSPGGEGGQADGIGQAAGRRQGLFGFDVGTVFHQLAVWTSERRRYAIGSLIVALCAVGVFWGIQRLVREEPPEASRFFPSQVYRAPVESGGTGLLRFGRFLVLFPGDGARAYLLLGLAIRPSTSEAFDEIRAQEAYFRKAIYDELKEIVERAGDQPVFDSGLKTRIGNVINRNLKSGRVNGIYFTELLVM